MQAIYLPADPEHTAGTDDLRKQAEHLARLVREVRTRVHLDPDLGPYDIYVGVLVSHGEIRRGIHVGDLRWLNFVLDVWCDWRREQERALRDEFAALERKWLGSTHPRSVVVSHDMIARNPADTVSMLNALWGGQVEFESTAEGLRARHSWVDKVFGGE